MNNICVVGLGYVGLPLALELSKHFNVVGFDVNKQRVSDLRNGMDYNEEYTVVELTNSSVVFTSNPEHLVEADFVIVTVPTPITDGNKPDLLPLAKASKLIGEYINPNRKPVVVYESTVYPGVTEEFCVPIIEREKKKHCDEAVRVAGHETLPPYKCGEAFVVGYSPERINPGDKVNTITTITKVVSGMDEETLNKVDAVYSTITKTHRASSIKVAEAAKVIENSQRDLNIAFVNELALIFDKLGIDTLDVLEAAGTKWNFLPFKPGLVGGHCISVDPYYLTYKAEDAGVISQVILAGRHVNDSMPHHVVNLVARGLNKFKKSVNGSEILVLGATFKENCKDVRNSKVESIVRELQEMGARVSIYDPFYEGLPIPFEHVKIDGEFGPTAAAMMVDAFVVAVAHDEIKEICESLPLGRPIIDIKGVMPKLANVIRL